MKQRAIIDVVCKSGVTNLATEIGALLGRELVCDDIQLQLLSKNDIFNDLERPASVITRMSITGDKEGNCFLLTRLDSSIILGGTLIMLPEDMIDEHIKSGKLDGELNDAFGEVGNIIAGVFTQAFVEKYPKNLRFIKKTVEELGSVTTIDLAGDDPFPPGNYYIASCKLLDGEQNIGPIEFIVPAAAFDLEEAAVEPSPAKEQTPPQPAAKQPEAPTPENAADTVEAAPAPAPAPAAPARPPFADVKKVTDVVFNATISQIGEEIGALLGQDLVCNDVKLLLTSKADFFADHCTDKTSMSALQVTGDREGCGYLFTQIPDAIVLGGTLIMLPEDQIEEQVGKKTLEGEVADAFGEVANILAGGLTQVFLDRYPKQLRFVRTESTLITPTQLDLDSSDPFPEGDYYLASFSINMEGYELDRFLLLFPAGIFDLDNYQDQSSTTTSATDQPAVAAQPTEAEFTAHDQAAARTTLEGSAAGATTGPAATPSGSPLVLIIAEDPNTAQPFAERLSVAGLTCKIISYQDDIKAPFRDNQVQGAILVMSKVNEKGFAAAIKLQSTGQSLPPLIFAGPEWTRSTVLRAVKYGAQDILITPASGAEIEEKISQHFRKAS